MWFGREARVKRIAPWPISRIGTHGPGAKVTMDSLTHAGGMLAGQRPIGDPARPEPLVPMFVVKQ